MSLKDGLWIALFYLLSVLVFQDIYILQNEAQLVFFIILSIGFAFFDEKVSLKLKRWEYTKKMPTVFGVGLSPLFEIAATGTLALLLSF